LLACSVGLTPAEQDCAGDEPVCIIKPLRYAVCTRQAATGLLIKNVYTKQWASHGALHFENDACLLAAKNFEKKTCKKIQPTTVPKARIKIFQF
jgi:uncharacterized membrane protein